MGFSVCARQGQHRQAKSRQMIAPAVSLGRGEASGQGGKIAHASASSPFFPFLYGPFSFHLSRTGTPASPRSSRMRFCKKPS